MTLTKRLTLPIAGLATAVLRVGMNFDDQMARVRAISGATQDDFEALRETAQELGATTRFAASEAAEGMEFLALAGFETSEIIEAMPGLLDLAAASAMELGLAADIVSDTMSAFRMDADQATEAADIFAQTSSMANTNVEQLGEAMKMAAPQAAAAGISLAETSAVLGVLADAGLKGGRAGTTLNAILRDMVSGAEDGAVAIGDTAVAVFDADGKFRDFNEVMRDVSDATVGLSDAQRENALRAVFQSQSIRGVNLLLGDGVDTLDDYIAANMESAGTAAEMADIMEDTLGGALRGLRSQFEGVMIQLSDELAPIVRETVIPLVQQFGRRISELIDWFSNLDDSQRRMILAAVGVAAAVGPVLLIVGKLVSLFGGLVVGVGKVLVVVGKLVGVVGFLLSPVGLVVAAVAALVAGLTLFFTRTETGRRIVQRITAVVRGLWDIFQTGEGVLDGIGNVIEAVFGEGFRQIFEDIVETARVVWDEIVVRVQTALNIARTVISVFISVVQAIWDRWGDRIMTLVSTVFEGARRTIVNVLNTVVSVIQGVLRVISGLFDTFVGVFTGDWSRAWEGVKNVFGGVWDTIVAILSGVWEQIKTFVSNGWEFVKNVVEGGVEVLRKVWDTAWEAIGNVVRWVWERTIGPVWEGLKAGIDVIVSVIETARDFWGTAWDAMKDAVKAAVNPIIGFLNAIIGGVESMVNAIANGLNRLPFVGSTIRIPDWVPSVGGNSFSVPSVPTVSLSRIPSLQTGGMFSAPTGSGLALLHDNERVLSRQQDRVFRQMVSVLRRMDARAVGIPGPTAAGATGAQTPIMQGPSVNAEVFVTATDPQAAAREFSREIGWLQATA